MGVVDYNRGLRGRRSASATFARGSLQGLQVGVLNVGGAVTGAQIGVINIADRVDGTQIGVINVANSSAAPVGVFNFIRDGYYRLQLWSSDLSAGQHRVQDGRPPRVHPARLRAGPHRGRPHPDERPGGDRRAPAPQGEPAVRRLRPGHRLDRDHPALELERHLNTARLVVGYQLQRHLAIIGGPTFNVHVFDRTETDRPGLGQLEWNIDAGSQQVRLFPGFVLGMQILRVGGGRHATVLTAAHPVKAPHSL